LGPPVVTRARAIFEGDTLMVTRRTRLRQLLLLPTDKTTAVITYLLAVYLGRHHLLAHAIVCLSNHYHLIATDPRGLITDFTRDFHAFVARHVNALHGEFDSLWSGAQTSLVRLEDGETILDKIGYTMANPVLSFLVETGEEWPGLRRAWPAPPLVIERPEGFLDIASRECKWPESATLEMTRPPGFDELSDTELADKIAMTIHDQEAGARAIAADKGIEFLGREAILRQSRLAAPTSREPHFGISPRVACKDPERRAARLRFLTWWLEEYQRCRQRWIAGDRTVAFPHGTNKMRRCHGVTVAPPLGAAPAAPPG
jgi:putative transposase